MTEDRKPEAGYTKTPAAICWLDVETTGLDPECDVLLEVAMVITDAQLNELTRAQVTIRHDRRVLAALIERPERPHEIVALIYSMHEANGLLNECCSNLAVSLQEAQKRLVKAVRDALARTPNPPEEGEKPFVLIGGCSPNFDRTFVSRYMPQLADVFHYRLIDATCLRFALDKWGSQQLPEKDKRHRALPDAEAALNLARRTKSFYVQAGRVLNGDGTLRVQLDRQQPVAL